MPVVTDPSFHREERLDATTMLVTRKSTFTGELHTLKLAITAAEWARWQGGPHVLIQDCFPALTDPEREFLLTGTTHAEWLAAFPPENVDDGHGGWEE